MQAGVERDGGRWAGAVVHYRRYLRYRPDDFAIWVQLGHMLGESGDPAGADQAYRTAHALNPDDADLALCRGHLARRGGDVEAAIVFYRRSFEIDGNERAATMLAELDVETGGGSETEQAPVHGGRLDGWFERSVSGVLSEDGVDDPWVVFRAGDRLVGQARPGRNDDGALEFRATLDVELGENGEGVEVIARRMPDGAMLEPGPFFLFPPSRHPADHAAAWSVPAEIVKPYDLPAGREVALFVTHSRSGKVKPNVLPYVRALRQAGLAVFLVATVDRPVDLPAELLDSVDAAMVRRNAGYDFAAWAHALKLHPRLYGAATLYLVNDSVVPAADDARIAAIVDRVRRSGADLIGLTESHEWRWHVQSYFLAIKPGLLASRSFHGFMDDVRLLTRKDHVIRAYEVRLG
ncbi:rhamnan synthesis F family protein, partial [Rhizorhabdus wittichii]|uniref:rhamnan synthesis F family protein n=1 Tax=Rhizorhabdus wittichii TaxID=160791 RepID=UPI0023428C35